MRIVCADLVLYSGWALRHQHISTIVYVDRCIAMYFLGKQEMAETDTLSSIGRSEVGHIESIIRDSEGDYLARDNHANANF